MSGQGNGGGRALRQSTFRDILGAIMEVRRTESGGGSGRAGSVLNDENYRLLLSDFIRNGATLADDDENDPDYRPEQDEELEEYDDAESFDRELDELGEELYEEDEEDLGFGRGWNNPNHPSYGAFHAPVKEPKPEGLALLYSGEFGRIRHQLRMRNGDSNVARLLLNRGARLRPSPREDLAAEIVPNTNGTAVASYTSNAYVGQYSSDSSFYYTCVRDFRLHVYDANAPIAPAEPGRRHALSPTGYSEDDHNTSMKVLKTIRAQPGGWTITDSHLSPDNQRIIYASVSNLVYMAHTIDSTVEQHAINFADPRSTGRFGYGDPHGVWSCKFSADGNEVIAGGTEMVFVYDLLADKRTVKIKAHEDDINSCCWADTASGNVLVSASDDSFLKVWDRRSLGSSPKPSGVLMGHTEGITYVSAKGDGRYVISNGKDQLLRLWDLRKMRTNLEFEQWRNKSVGFPNFDYRRGIYPKTRHKEHPMNCSVMQYTGHDVLRTLIRCHFSPAETTGGQYIYSGSADGRIHIWSLDGRVVQVLDRSGTLPMSYHPSEPQLPNVNLPHRKVCVRDVSWHSQQPILMSAGWLGTSWGLPESSVIARHEWKGLSKMGYNLVDHAEKESLEAAERVRGVSRGQRSLMPGSYGGSLGMLDDN
ncbi:WD40-repeat-containing domain protein [Cytidiella melzeri]|nr:WD40-repeat-containing domain protein [Cytidiella melzeri]